MYFTELRLFNFYLIRKRAEKKGNRVMVKRIWDVGSYIIVINLYKLGLRESIDLTISFSPHF
ncbi:hypothetical protein Phpb_00739 [Photorhabdus namnaonensis]|uniref:Uncharacterized protein n=1 Tax=Photorhabdus namnaonensis TaxID=1851568 RepID=A0A1B8YM55_9GAMM|nr:hypothetical protein Phpb_00739 [Photorhabdus namnaonensis]